jgi:hypothetical protein
MRYLPTWIPCAELRRAGFLSRFWRDLSFIGRPLSIADLYALTISEVRQILTFPVSLPDQAQAARASWLPWKISGWDIDPGSTFAHPLRRRGAARQAGALFGAEVARPSSSGVG